jgi:murein DD-endopeptidase MepM/ murein hydrolase activator NlpD
MTDLGSGHRAPRRLSGTALMVVGLGLATIVVLGVVVVLTRFGSAAASSTGLPSAGAIGSTSPSPSATPTATVAPTPTVAPTKALADLRFVFPVRAANASYARDHHDYPASDIMAACGSPVLAVTDGVILEVNRIDTWDPKVNAGATRGGLSVSLLGDDGVRYYGSHLRSILPAIEAGVRVTAGQNLGEVGDTGDAGACHLHFGISPVCARTGDWWIRRGVIWPWPYLDAWRKATSKSALTEITAWSAAHGCPSSATAEP